MGSGKLVLRGCLLKSSLWLIFRCNILGDTQTPVAYNASAVQHNIVVVSYCRTALAALAGVAAGVLGLTGIIGFLFYFGASLVLSLILLCKAGLKWRNYFLYINSICWDHVFGEITTYILCWTFMYGMVHVY